MDILQELKLAKKQLYKDRASQEHLEKSIETESKKLKIEQDHLVDIDQAQTIFVKAAEDTQKKLEVHISRLVTTAISSVFGTGVYDFELDFIKRRGKTEADLWLVRNGQRMKPIDSVGGGVVDVVSFALRVAFWALSKNTRPIFILDEPFRNVSNNYVSKALDMMKMLSEKLELQIIMISHNKVLIEGADRIFHVELSNDISTVKGY
jgi:DNA repair exonuclease SbcCD ATPase subunit